ncbi:MAG: tRNA dihydrouridine(20/20a) synthase DusA [Gammaproteobacteria bacterium]
MNTLPGALEPAAWRLCIAPMMQRTDRHFRYLARLLSPHARLYTEMINTGAILYGQRERFLAHHPDERPLALQLGGSDPDALASCAGIAVEYGYAEINLNCGCPSERVQSGAFGACLMRDPQLVARCIEGLTGGAASQATVSVKTRLGVDELYSYAYFSDFIGTLSDAGCRVFHVHARKAWLQGLSPRENREIPPLEHAWVHRLKREYPHLVVITNGGIDNPAAACAQLDAVDGVMVGRHAYAVPFDLVAFDAALFGGDTAPPTRAEVVDRYIAYAAVERANGTPLRRLSRHLLNLYRGAAGARHWRRLLTEHAMSDDAQTSAIRRALPDGTGRDRERAAQARVSSTG